MNTNKPDVNETIAPEKENNNITIIANALGLDEDARSIQYIISALNTVEAGQLQEAEFKKENEEDIFLDVVTEDNRELRIYLSQSYKVEAVQNISTGEWLIVSNR